MKNTFFKNNTNLRRDTLTELYDRQVIIDYAKYLISKNTPFCLALIDIDNFKNINDGYGHAIGDRSIKLMADKIREAFDEKAEIGRFGGDEFILVIPEITDYDKVWQVCRDAFWLIDNVESDFLKGLQMTCTLGLSRFDKDAQDFDALMEKADKALYRGKMKGRSCFIIYLEEKHAHIKLRSTTETQVSSMQLHNQIMRLLTASDDIGESIQNLFKFLSSTLMIDHIALQSDDRLIYSTVYSLSREKSFQPIKNSLIAGNINPAMSIFFQNDIRQLEKIGEPELMLANLNQGVCSCCYAEVSCQNKFYGYLRCDSSSTNRIWQYNDMDLLLTAAKTIALMLHYQNKTLDDLK